MKGPLLGFGDDSTDTTGLPTVSSQLDAVAYPAGRSPENHLPPGSDRGQRGQCEGVVRSCGLVLRVKQPEVSRRVQQTGQVPRKQHVHVCAKAQQNCPPT